MQMSKRNSFQCDRVNDVCFRFWLCMWWKKSKTDSVYTFCSSKQVASNVGKIIGYSVGVWNTFFYGFGINSFVRYWIKKSLRVRIWIENSVTKWASEENLAVEKLRLELFYNVKLLFVHFHASQKPRFCDKFFWKIIFWIQKVTAVNNFTTRRTREKFHKVSDSECVFWQLVKFSHVHEFNVQIRNVLGSGKKSAGRVNLLG